MAFLAQALFVAGLIAQAQETASQRPLASSATVRIHVDTRRALGSTPEVAWRLRRALRDAFVVVDDPVEADVRVRVSLFRSPYPYEIRASLMGPGVLRGVTVFGQSWQECATALSREIHRLVAAASGPPTPEELSL